MLPEPPTPSPGGRVLSREAALAAFGCTGWAEQALGDLGRLGGRRRQASEDGLTQSERRVADLAATNARLAGVAARPD